MRRKDREITDITVIMRVIDRCKVCRLGLSARNMPYVVPLNYGYTFKAGRLTLFFHGAAEGRKIDMIRENPRACFEIDDHIGVVKAGTICAYGYAFKSVIGFGDIVILEDPDERRGGLRHFLRHQIGNELSYMLPDKMPRNLLVYKLDVQEFTGKHRPLRGFP